MDEFIFNVFASNIQRGYGGNEKIVTPADVATWKAAGETFKHVEYTLSSCTIAIQLDCSPALSRANYRSAVADLSFDEQVDLYSGGMNRHELLLITGRMIVSPLPSTSVGGDLAREYIVRYLSHVFLALNLSSPGILSFLYSRIEIVGVGQFLDLRLSNELFEYAFCRCLEADWPVVMPLDLDNVWDWIRSLDIFDRGLASSPAEMALFSLLHVARIGTMDPSSLVWCARALEGLFESPANSAFLGTFSRMALFLQLPGQRLKEVKRAFRSFYDLRSAYVHGRLPVDQPFRMGLDRDIEGQEEEALDAVSLPINCLVSCVQRLICLRWKGISYREVEEGVPC